MSEEIKVPGFGESVTEAVVVNILKPSGSIVKEDEEILELESEKVNQVVHAPAAGKLELSVNVNDTVKIGQVIGKIDTGAKASAEAEKAPPKEEKKTAPAPKEEKPAPAPAPAKKEAPAPSKETARRTPEEFVKKTEEKAQPEEKPIKPAPKEGKERRERMTGLRKTIARRLVEVKNQTAMLTTFNEVDMSAVIAIRAKEKEKFEKRFGVKLGFMSFFVKASIAALKAFPEINAYIEGDEIIYPSGYHIGVAVSTEKGLFVPVIKQAQDLSYADIEKQLIEYAKQAREGKISMDALKGGTFTITNGGVFGSLLSTPILNPPQSGILGMHAIVKRPVAIGDKVEIRPMMYLALSYDHRIVDGKEAVSFLVHMKENLEDPARQLLDF